MRFNEYAQQRLPFHTATYWVTVLQLLVYALAALWLLRNVGHRGFWHTSSVAVRAMQNTP